MSEGWFAGRADPRRRAVFFDLAKIEFPVGAVASFLHRVSGVLLLLSLPLLVYVFHYSLAGPDEFGAVAAIARGPWAKALAIVVTWSLVHHVLAGVRHLLMDSGVGWRLPAARRTAWFANIAALALTVFVASKIL